MKRFLIGFLVLLICAAAAVVQFRADLGHKTSKFNLILNRLRLIEAAKSQWAADHPDAKGRVPVEQDLTPYLDHDFWKKSVAGEDYLIHSMTEPAEAQLTKHVDSIPANASVRWGPDGDIQIRTNKSLQWPNKPDAANPAMTSQLHAELHWRRVADPERSATT